MKADAYPISVLGGILRRHLAACNSPSFRRLLSAAIVAGVSVKALAYFLLKPLQQIHSLSAERTFRNDDVGLRLL